MFIRILAIFYCLFDFITVYLNYMVFHCLTLYVFELALVRTSDEPDKGRFRHYSNTSHNNHCNPSGIVDFFYISVLYFLFIIVIEMCA